MSTPALSVRGLTVSFPGPGGPECAVDRLDLHIESGETLGLVGESGCGKTMTALAVVGLLPRSARRLSGSVRLAGRELTGLRAEQLRRVRGAEIGMIFQEPATSLHPALTVGDQVAEALLVHDPRMTRARARRAALDLLSRVGVPSPGRRAVEYPQTWSGGMRQRAMIAMAIANRPRVIIADEPTTALDVTVQAQVLDLLRHLRDQTGAALLLISHDLGVVSEMADRVAVMYAGRIVESASTESLFLDPRHPYTAGLIASIPRLDAGRGPLPFIPGRPPSLSNLPSGCSFHPRCPLADQGCIAAPPPLVDVGETRPHLAACFHSDRVSVPGGPARATEAEVRTHSEPEPLLEVEDLAVHFRTRSGWIPRRENLIRAVDGISFSIGRGQTLALVGESGCGKTTTARAILRLIEPTRGSIRFRGTSIERLSSRELKPVRRHIQAVFQDPYSSLNPRKTVAQIVASPLSIHGEWKRPEIMDKVSELLALVGLGEEVADRYPAALSGGQRQRVGIARALALDPELVVLDEPLSALDLSIQAQIINLLRDLQRRLGLSYLFIAHDLSVVRSLADRVAVMYLGRIVESGSRDEVFERPTHPYTRALLSAVPVAGPARRRPVRIVLEGEVPGPDHNLPGCVFASRCYRSQPGCHIEDPALVGEDHQFACFFPITEPLTARTGPGFEQRG